MKTSLSVTRVVNASVLVESTNAAVLTDPYFTSHWFMRMREPIGVRPEELPKLSAIVGGHSVFDHWQPRSLEGYPHKRETPVFVATASMRKSALAAGFTDVEVVRWGERRRLSDDLEIEVVPAQRTAGFDVNNYVFTFPDVRVFFGSEARDIEPLRRYRSESSSSDLALLPIDGSTLLGKKLVMNADDAIAAARALGANTLIPIHYAMKAIPPLLGTPSSEVEMRRLVPDLHELRVVLLETGKRWSYSIPA